MSISFLVGSSHITENYSGSPKTPAEGVSSTLFCGKTWETCISDFNKKQLLKIAIYTCVVFFGSFFFWGGEGQGWLVRQVY